MPKQTLEIIKNPDKPIAAEIMEQAIVDIAEAMRRINQTRFCRGAIVALIKDKSGLNKSTIELVLNNLDDFENIWLKPVRK